MAELVTLKNLTRHAQYLKKYIDGDSNNIVELGGDDDMAELVTFDQMKQQTEKEKEYIDSKLNFPSTQSYDSDTNLRYPTEWSYNSDTRIASREEARVVPVKITVPAESAVNTSDSQNLSVASSESLYSFANQCTIVANTQSSVFSAGNNTQLNFSGYGASATLNGNNCSVTSGYRGYTKTNLLTINGDNASIRIVNAYCYVNSTVTGNNLYAYFSTSINLWGSITNYGDNATITSSSSIMYINALKVTSAGDNARISASVYQSSDSAYYGVNSSGNNATITVGGNGYKNTSRITISGGSATVFGNTKVLSVTGSNAYLADSVSVDSSIEVTQGVANSTIFPANAAVTITNNSDGNIYYYAGTRNATDSLSALGNNDTIYIEDSTSTVTDTTVSGGAQLQINSGSYNSYVVIQGKTTGDTINVQMATDAARIYTIGTGFSE